MAEKRALNEGITRGVQKGNITGQQNKPAVKPVALPPPPSSKQTSTSGK